MSNQLILRLIDNAVEPESVLPWFLFDSQKALVAQGQHALRDIYLQVTEELKNNLTIRVIVPNDTVLLAQVNIPSQNAKQIKQALPYAVEELIAEEIENVHMALPVELDSSNHRVDVAVISHHYLISWLDLLHHNNLSPDDITVDTLCVPYTGACSVLVDHQRLLLRSSHSHGLVCDSGNFSELYSLYRSENSDDQDSDSLEILFCADEGAVTEFPHPDAVEHHYKESSHEILATTLAQAGQPAINLLQGGYKQVDSASAGKTIWLKPIAAAVACLFLFVISHLSIGMYFNYKADMLSKQSIAYYKSLFPEERRVINPKRQLSNHLRLLSNGEGGTFLSTLSAVAGEFKHFTTASKILVNQMSYSKDTQSLKLELTSQTIEQLDELKQQLAAVGVSAAIGSARVQEGGIISNVTVEAL